MITEVPFLTKARTIDHLGREQIADCPTAISELWKNAYDAYARNVSIDIYSGNHPVAVISDDGHGMNIDEIRSKWLVIGTEGKMSLAPTDKDDRNGLKIRPKQGQKGIGRLSCGHLGSLLLLVSKKTSDSFAVCLIDWRLFQNPYLLLEDIKIPTATFETKEEVLKSIPSLYESLMGNVWGSNLAKDEIRDLRIAQAWKQFDQTENSHSPNKKTTRELLEETLIDNVFEDCHFDNWNLWTKKSEHGTALLIGNIDDSLFSLLDRNPTDSLTVGIKEKFFETLSGFSDPFSKDQNQTFKYSANTWNGNIRTEILGPSKEFNTQELDLFEHIIDGEVDENGLFKGKVKSFGKWLELPEEIRPTEGLIIPTRINSFVGPFRIFVATSEMLLSNTTLTPEQHAKYKEQVERYSGFKLYRDNLRVMPYGRSDSDFFEIERRRSLHAGTEFWNHRRMIGRVAINKLHNPNLRDKAGREGVVDNRAAKALKDIVINILKSTARVHFGTLSEQRKELLPQIQNDYKKAKAEEQQKKLQKKKRKTFRTNLKKNAPLVERDLFQIKQIFKDLSSSDICEELITSARAKSEDYRATKRDYILGPPPSNLGENQELYSIYRANIIEYTNILSSIEQTSIELLEQVNPTVPEDYIEKEILSKTKSLSTSINKWANEIKALQNAESSRIEEIAKARKVMLKSQLGNLIESVKVGDTSLTEALNMIEVQGAIIDQENTELFPPYIAALEYLQENIDLQLIATSVVEESIEMRQEIGRLNQLAQLGIAVEIIGHELEDYDSTIGSGINILPEEIQSSKALKLIRLGYEGLTNRLRFLGPLKLSGEQNQQWITGERIHQFVSDFFASSFSEKQITFNISESFSKFKLFDLESRILPVFINLVNNSIYWTAQSGSDKLIQITCNNDRVIVSDSGPGVEEDDIKRLFTLFFTRKLRGGRGVGLYLCRANLGASGHSISYISDPGKTAASGANFEIEFKGATYE